MKTFKAICAALVIALSLSIPAYAEDPKNPGDVHYPGSANPGGDPKNPTKPGTPEVPEGSNPTLTAIADILLKLVSVF